MTTQQHPPLYLASTSVYRRALLQKLTTQFSCVKPEVDESPLPDETAQALVNRLALAKANAVAATLSDGLVIGSDQVAVFQGEILGKPHTVANAEAQLKRFSGQAVTFLTGLAVVNAATGKVQQAIDPFVVHFRELSDAEIRHYVAREQPLDCAGSFKSEGLGIALFDKLQGDDPNSLIGLPVIRLLAMLRHEGLNLLLQNQ
ncbi:Maf family protein [Alishewanella jeotgali]|jgi:MAF protein|uniref:7-methyl-GTP pyrophosphatase n=1 Tax=Alishewanella jeotgali KCTC 22429 TaxID=1129374 RepID=H3ZJ22_9ALTE|nr:nucleoside triphosphate pyrophosphatase [Alishewanella jeotgali]EHR39491.1 maf protein [Alishewanella jeotgali KCTC 22429]